jgi:hypothetical protein
MVKRFCCSPILSSYSIFDSALYRSLRLKWFFHQEKATLHDLTMATCKSKMLWRRIRSKEAEKIHTDCIAGNDEVKRMSAVFHASYA